MAKELIVPGVSVSVVREMLPQQLSPSGVLGLIGYTEKKPAEGIGRASSWNRFIELFGAASASSLPEARAALDNGVYELVVVPLEGGSAASCEIAADAGKLTLTARAPGAWALAITATVKMATQGFDLTLELGGRKEEFRNLTLDATAANADGPRNVAAVLAKDSALCQAEVSSDAKGAPKAGAYRLNGADGSAGLDNYRKAIDALAGQPDVDMVLASVSSTISAAEAQAVYSAVLSHCNNMSEDGKGRIAIGQTPPRATDEQIGQLADTLKSDRFLLVTPFGTAGAAAGRVGSLDYYESPTFKTVSGVSESGPAMAVEAQRSYLQRRVVPVVFQQGKGVIILRAITTSGEQVSVTRIADRAVRGMKQISDGFIGRLNSEDQRTALRQKLVEMLMQMVKDGALVPSADGKSPPFVTNVYSSQADFALGIVRVEMAVRPVRAIDYIYATITVQV